MKNLILSFLFLSLHSHAQHEMIIQSLDRDVDLTKIEGKGFKKVYGVTTLKEQNELPAVDKQKALFAKADLEKDLGKMDQLDRDMFFKSVKAYSVEKTSTLYPQISALKIKKLKAMVK